MILDSCVPYAILNGKIRPVLKNGKLSKFNNGNYRPVMKSSDLLKTLEYLILPVQRHNLKLSSRQFGLRPNTIFEAAVATAQETIRTYP